MRDLTTTELGMLVKACEERAKALIREATGRRNQGPRNAQYRETLRRQARKYQALAAELARDLGTNWETPL